MKMYNNKLLNNNKYGHSLNYKDGQNILNILLN